MMLYYIPTCNVLPSYNRMVTTRGLYLYHITTDCNHIYIYIPTRLSLNASFLSANNMVNCQKQKPEHVCRVDRPLFRAHKTFAGSVRWKIFKGFVYVLGNYRVRALVEYYGIYAYAMLYFYTSCRTTDDDICIVNHCSEKTGWERLKMLPCRRNSNIIDIGYRADIEPCSRTGVGVLST